MKKKILKILQSNTSPEEMAVQIENLFLRAIPNRESYDRDDITNPEFATLCSYKDGWNACISEIMNNLEED